MKALVTGANGFIGTHICQELIKNNIKVTAFVRNGSRISHIQQMDLDIFHGDIRNYTEINNAMQNCQIVFHTAAVHLQWANDYKHLYDVNVEGTRNICEAAQKNKVKRIIYTSTQNLIEAQKKQLADESDFFKPGRFYSHYTKSKFAAEKIILDYVQQGLDIVIVSPSGPFGKGDYKPGPTGKIIQNFINKKYPFYFKAWFNIIDVEDIARGHYLAYKKGKKGERYILSNKDISLDEFFDMLTQLTGVKKPFLRIPRISALIIALIMEFFAKYITHKPPLITLDRIIQRGRPKFLNNKKAIEELGLTFTPIMETLKKAVNYYKNY